MKNILLLSDVYKYGHLEQYVPGITKVYSYLCARSNKKYDKALFFGLQYYLKEYFSSPITKENVDEFLEYRKLIIGDSPKQEFIDKLYSVANLGYLPLEIKAVPEGTYIENKNVLMTITNTHPDAYWLVGFVESLLLKVWNTTTVATYSKKLKTLVEKFSNETSSNNDLVPFQVHDFGYRGCSSEETAALSGAAHLINFLGTDTVPAVKLLKEYYKAEFPIGLSVPASEHSVMCSFGIKDEYKAFENMLNLYPKGIVSIVSDTYNLWNVLTNFTEKLKYQILNRDGKVVFRPDSGNPEKIICGDPEALPGSPEHLGALRCLENAFGSTVNSKGFKELNPKVGLIYGDGMYYERFERILNKLKEMGYASSNLVVGIGGLLLQQHNRDDLGFAIKATYVEINGVGTPIMKDPITDSGKKSHTGLLKLDRFNGVYKTFDLVSKFDEKEGFLQRVYLNGRLMKEQTLDDIRKRSNE